MRSLTGLSVRGVRRRPGRFALTGAGVSLGVAVLYAVLVTSGATTAALDDAISGSAGETDVFVGPVGAYDATIDPAVVDRVAAVDGVERAIGQVVLRSAITRDTAGAANADADRRILFVLGTDLEAAAGIRSFDLRDGVLPGPDTDEIAVGWSLADDLDLTTGQTLDLVSPTGHRSMLVTGVLEAEGAGLGFQGALAYTSLSTGRALLGKGDVFTGVDVVLDRGVDTDEWIAQHREDIGEGFTIQDARDVAGGFRSFIVAISGGLTLMAAIAVFVGGFLVFLTFTVAVAERTRTYGTLRALGAHPSQVRRVVIGEALVLGLAGSLVGLILGRLIAGASVGATETLLGLQLRDLGMPPGPAIVGVVVGVGVSVGAAWLPGRRAATVSPVSAMREGAMAVERSGRWWPRAALLAVGVALSTTGSGVTRRSLSTVMVLLAAVLLAPFVLQPVASVVGRLTQQLARGAGPIAVMHLVKERSRSAYTLALVMVVLAMLIAISGANTAMSNTLDEVIDRQTGGAVQVASPGSFDPAVGEQLLSLQGARAATPIRFGQTDRVTQESDGRSASAETTMRVDITVVEASTYFDIAGFSWVDGDDASATSMLTAGGAVLAPDSAAAGAGVERGETVLLRTSDGLQPFEVAGTYAVIGPGFGMVVGSPDADGLGAGRPNAYLVDPEPGVDVEGLARSIDVALVAAGYDPIVDTARSTRDQAFAQLQGFFGLAYVILLVAAAAGLLGLANTLAVSVLSRTREIGVLRSVGTTRRQVRRMVLVEAVTLALVAFALALPLGLLLNLGTAATFRGAIGASIDVTVPWAVLPGLLAVTLVVAVIASRLPARRAGRLEPVAALRFD